MLSSASTSKTSSASPSGISSLSTLIPSTAFNDDPSSLESEYGVSCSSGTSPLASFSGLTFGNLSSLQHFASRSRFCLATFLPQPGYAVHTSAQLPSYYSPPKLQRGIMNLPSTTPRTLYPKTSVHHYIQPHSHSRQPGSCTHYTCYTSVLPSHPPTYQSGARLENSCIPCLSNITHDTQYLTDSSYSKASSSNIPKPECRT